MSAVTDACREIRGKASMYALAQRAGLEKLRRERGEFKACCPFHADHSPSFTIFDDDRRWHCFGPCGGGDQLDFVRRFWKVPLVEAIRMIDSGALPVVVREPVDHDTAAEKTEKVEQARAIWRAASPAPGTLAEMYLRQRGINTAIPESIRFARLKYGCKGPLHPCLVALVASADNQFSGIQRTYLNAAGTGKAAVPKAKLSLGRVKSGAIRLAPAAAELVVCEGLEDGLTLRQDLGRAVWVAAGAGMMPAMRLPIGCDSVVIGADADEAGEIAAQAAASSFRAAGRAARIIRPSEGFKDFNAELQGIRT